MGGDYCSNGSSCRPLETLSKEVAKIRTNKQTRIHEKLCVWEGSRGIAWLGHPGPPPKDKSKHSRSITFESIYGAIATVGDPRPGWSWIDPCVQDEIALIPTLAKTGNEALA